MDTRTHDFAVEHLSGCRDTEPAFAGDIGAIEIWLIDWLTEACLACDIALYV